MPNVLPFWAEFYLLILAFLLGSCAGSFITCAADRYVAKESVLRGRSHCPECGRTLGIIDLIPIFSYLFLGGRCRKCGAPIPIRCLFTELLGGMTYLTVVYAYGLSFHTLALLIVVSVLLAVSLIDLDTMEIPDGLTFSLVVVYLLYLLTEKDTGTLLMEGLLGSVAIGGGILLLTLLMDVILKKETMGGGDIKLLGVLGLYTGLASGLLMVVLACIAGLVLALCVKRNNKKEFPFGPAIAFAALFTLLVGKDMVGAYLSLFL